VAVWIVALGVLPGVAHAMPDLRRGQRAGPVTVYPDDRSANIYYYPPGEMALAAADDGRPDFRFLHMRYTGNVTTGDRGRSVYRSLLSFRVVLSGPTVQQLAAARAALAAGRGSIELRPLPVRRLEAVLLDTGAAGAAAGQAATPQPLSGGHFDAPDENGGGGSSAAYWTERIYSLVLDADTAQLLSDSLEHGRLALSLGYAFFADGIASDQPLEELRGSPELVAQMRQLLQSQATAAATAGTPAGAQKAQLVRAGALGITVDTIRWPGLVTRIDVGGAAPPAYAFLDVYCYDFNNEIRPDLSERQVELEAEGVALGRRVRLAVVFQRAQPDLYARTVRFPGAVRIDRPYRFRVIDVAPDGTTTDGAWQTRSSWTDRLDVTSAPPRTAASER
jgi:hypothetical protein